MKMLVLAGGFGSRLKMTVVGVPKALAPIEGVPFLQLQLKHWIAQGVREFIFLLYHQAEQIIAYLETQRTGILVGCQVSHIIEPTPLDTGGAVANVVRNHDLKGSFLVTNADTWLGGGIHAMTQGQPPAMAIINLANVDRYGQVQFDADHWVTAFIEKKVGSGQGWINAGLYQLNASHFANWDGGPFSLERDLFTSLVQNRHLRVVPLQTGFMDIGVPDDYLNFCRLVEMGRLDLLCK